MPRGDTVYSKTQEVEGVVPTFAELKEFVYASESDEIPDYAGIVLRVRNTEFEGYPQPGAIVATWRKSGDA